MAVAGATLDVMLADGFLANVEAMGRRLKDGLQMLAGRFPTVIVEARGAGLLLGLKLQSAVTAGDFVATALRQGLLLVPAADNVARVLPPLIAGPGEVDEGLDMLGRVCQSLA